MIKIQFSLGLFVVDYGHGELTFGRHKHICKHQQFIKFTLHILCRDQSLTLFNDFADAYIKIVCMIFTYLFMSKKERAVTNLKYLSLTFLQSQFSGSLKIINKKTLQNVIHAIPNNNNNNKQFRICSNTSIKKKKCNFVLT